MSDSSEVTDVVSVAFWSVVQVTAVDSAIPAMASILKLSGDRARTEIKKG